MHFHTPHMYNSAMRVVELFCRILFLGLGWFDLIQSTYLMWHINDDVVPAKREQLKKANEVTEVEARPSSTRY